MLIPVLGPSLIFPHPGSATPDGVVAIGGDLTVERLVLAYEKGIFPWYNENQPIIWWSPNPRCVLYPGHLHISRRSRRLFRQGRFEVSFDRAFNQVIHHCRTIRRHGDHGTWITSEMEQAYNNLHLAGHAHSVEVWSDGELVGGLYGVAIGECFCGESMFSIDANASKFALFELSTHLIERGFSLIDVQMPTRHLLSLGAEIILRSRFLRELSQALLHSPRFL